MTYDDFDNNAFEIHIEGVEEHDDDPGDFSGSDGDDR